MNAPLKTPFTKTFGGTAEQRQLVSAVTQLITANNALSTVGAPLTASATLTPTASIHHVSGTAPISFIAPLKNAVGPLHLIADGAWSIVTGGNIGTARTAIVGRTMTLIYDGAAWWPL